MDKQAGTPQQKSPPSEILLKVDFFVVAFPLAMSHAPSLQLAPIQGPAGFFLQCIQLNPE